MPFKTPTARVARAVGIDASALQVSDGTTVGGTCAAAGAASDATMITGTQRFTGAAALVRSGLTTSARRERNVRTSSESVMNTRRLIRCLNPRKFHPTKSWQQITALCITTNLAANVSVGSEAVQPIRARRRRMSASLQNRIFQCAAVERRFVPLPDSCTAAEKLVTRSPQWRAIEWRSA